MVFGEGVPALGQNLVPGPPGHEHADAPPLVQDALVHQQIDALGGGGGIDGVELCQLVGAGHLLLLQKDAPQDVRLDHLPDLEVDGFLFCQPLVH